MLLVSLAPFDSFLMIKYKDLGSRMNKHNLNAKTVAEYPEERS